MIDLKKLAKTDPVQRNVEKGLEEVEHTPMDPPDAYSASTVGNTTFSDYAKPIQQLINEHKLALEKIEDFERAVVQFKENGYQLDSKINEIFGVFFKYFDENISNHNHKEEKTLFPVLNKKLIEAGEHSVGEHMMTAIDVMEDDHVKFIQLGVLTFNFLGLATRISDIPSRMFIFDTAYENARELIESLKLHIYREDHTLFPLAHKYISKEEFEEIERLMDKF
ncbi:MAG: hemerythrin domain-containing protein [Bacteroidetes bacterium]|nr:hemerythrin domain-containing protein [Bacteroidota bacterium]